MSDRNKEKFDAIKSSSRRPVTLYFPEKGGTVYGSEEAIVEKCTVNYVNLRRPAQKGEMTYPGAKKPLASYTIPEKAVSVPLEHLAVAEDMEKKRLMLVFDRSFWGDE